jgi:hypothetical protein
MFVEDKTTEFQREYADGCAMSIFSAQPYQSDMNTPQGAFPAACFYGGMRLWAKTRAFASLPYCIQFAFVGKRWLYC